MVKAVVPMSILVVLYGDQNDPYPFYPWLLPSDPTPAHRGRMEWASFLRWTDIEMNFSV
jgi:hypothetical protein